MKKTTVNKTKDKEYELPCVRCDGKTWHKALVSVDADGNEPSWGYQYSENYQVVQCQGCRSLSFRKNEINTEDTIDDDEGRIVCVDHEELFPSRVAGRPKLRQAEHLPYSVRSIYDETHHALCNKQRVLAGIGIRALVETVCKEKEATGRDLEKKIDNLVNVGVLTTDGAEILHSLRILGNKAAHEVKPHSESTLNTAMDVIEHLLKGVYILPEVAQNLPKRKIPTEP